MVNQLPESLKHDCEGSYSCYCSIPSDEQRLPAHNGQLQI